MKPASLLVPASAALIALFIVGLSAPVGAKHAPQRFDLVEATIASIQDAIEDHVISAEQLVRMYHKRIAAYNGPQTATRLNAYIHVNTHALDEADDSDHEGDQDRGEGRQHNALAGIPMILKDNIDTRDMPTTPGSLAFEGSFPRSDAFVARKLREAGAIILGKATMTEFANFLTNGMPAGYSSLGGYGFNPYDPRPDPRMALDALMRPFNDGRPALTPGGSSSGPGIAVAASLAAVGIGTETSGSILSPGTANGLVGIKPTVGLISRDGIVPITADQDTAGPLARTVTDAAIVLVSSPVSIPMIRRPGLSDARQLLEGLHRDSSTRTHQGARIVVRHSPANGRSDGNAIAVFRAQGAYVETRTVGRRSTRRVPFQAAPGELSTARRSPTGATLLDRAELRVQARSQPVHPRPREAFVPHPVARGRGQLQRRAHAGRDEIRSGSRDLLAAVRSLANQCGHGAIHQGPRGGHHEVAWRDRDAP